MARLTALLILFLMPTALAIEAQDPPVDAVPMRVEVTVVSLYCTVKDSSGRLVTHLSAADFRIEEDGQPQQLRYFDRETDRPLRLALLVDTSISQKTVLPAEREAAGRFLRQVLRPIDQALVMSFDVNLEVWQDLTPEMSRLQWALSRLAVNNQLRVQPGEKAPAKMGGTRLYDALREAADRLSGASARKAIVVISDGVDSGSRTTEKEALAAVQRADAIIYVIRFTDPAYYWRLTNRPGGGDNVLLRLAGQTGGRVLFPARPQHLTEAFEQVSAELRSQYSLGYTPANRKRDGRFRQVSIRVNRSGYKVLARNGYFAPRD
ncbi:MAG TPA: VWA domain-containing protein [Candidatus Xenobia bacterium]|nr:VWA domain-containing protein [Candidatus Xenobia bacterium]